jgi:4-hydroxy-tetrahydrodipicolinate reductase
LAKIAIIGYGKMGKEIERILIQQNHSITAIIDNQSDWETMFSDFLNSDVAIEFSTPESAIDNFKRCFENNIPLVAGTTGWFDQLPDMINLCSDTSKSFIYGSNFSIGANLFFKINEYAAKLINGQPQYDVIIEETHHLTKKDIPSGTAITTANIILEQIDRKNGWELNGQNAQNITIKANRVENVPGTHNVHYFSYADSINIEHIANNRSGLATGAVNAALWLINNKGIYDFKNIFHLVSQIQNK